MDSKKKQKKQPACHWLDPFIIIIIILQWKTALQFKDVHFPNLQREDNLYLVGSYCINAHQSHPKFHS